MNVIFDLDGTLIDSKPRLYALFQELAPCSSLSFDEYWLLKRNQVSNAQILSDQLGLPERAIRRFFEDWMKLIEDPRYLKLDRAFPGVLGALTELREQANLHLCTNRQDRRRTEQQLESLGMTGFFRKIMVTEQRNTKDQLIRSEVQAFGEPDWLVGDTGEDIRIGRLCKLQTCAVSNGFSSPATLARWHPDLILPSVIEFSVDPDLAQRIRP